MLTSKIVILGLVYGEEVDDWISREQILEVIQSLQSGITALEKVD